MQKSFCRPPPSPQFSQQTAAWRSSWLEREWGWVRIGVRHLALQVADERWNNFFKNLSREASWSYVIAMLPTSIAVALGEQKDALIDRWKRLQQGFQKSYALKGKRATEEPGPRKSLDRDKSSADETEKESTCCERNIDEAFPDPALMDIMSNLPDARDLASCSSPPSDAHLELRPLKSLDRDKSSADLTEKESTCCERNIEEALPDAMLMEIMSKLPDARDLARCALVNKNIRSHSKSVKSVRFVCRLEHIRPKNGQPFRFRDSVTGTLIQLKCVETLVLEIEDEIMLANKFKNEEIEKNSLWLTEKPFIMKWLDPVKTTLQNLTVIDYGQQAIFRPTNLLQRLSEHCKQLRTLELRNMFLECKDMDKMSKITTLTLRCVKLSPYGLKEINEKMPNLETLTLVTVVGLKTAEFKSSLLKVLCLGLATKVDSVKLEVRSLIKLQLKMACPENLLVIAPELKCLAVCMDKRDKPNVKFQDVKLLKELLMGASEFTTLDKLSSSNPLLDKVFLDVPCMAFEDSGSWKGILNVPLDIPNMDALRSCCPNLQTMSVGPGLWYALEVESTKNGTGLTLKWPALKRLILHLIVRDPRTSMVLLTALVKAIPSLTTLEVYVHTDCIVGNAIEFGKELKKKIPDLDPICDTWKKGLRFECFSF